MKQAKMIKAFVMLAAVTLIAIPALAGNGNGAGGGITPLSVKEIDHLTFVREEEKLARDVYLHMNEVYAVDEGTKIFYNIAESEQKHMDTVLKMLIKYGLPDPAFAERGDFDNYELQVMYDTLVSSGEVSYIEALKVGVAIEVYDIIDIGEAIEDTDRVDLITAYGHLVDGSYNHLASFCSTLATQGVTCETQGIDPALFDAIMDIY